MAGPDDRSDDETQLLPHEMWARDGVSGSPGSSGPRPPVQPPADIPPPVPPASQPAAWWSAPPVAVAPEPWPHTPGVTHGPARTEPRTVRIAILAAVLSAVITGAMSFALFRLTTPATGAPGASSVALVAPTATPTAAPAATPAPTIAPVSVPASIVPAPAGSVEAAVARAIPGVVTILTEDNVGFRTASGSGSGFVFGADGWILTNAHVVDGATAISVAFADGRQLPGQVYGISSTTDLAVIRVDATGLPAIAIGDSTGLALGQTVIAIGSPLGEYPNSVTTGVVSGLDRTISIRRSGSLDGLIQTDAAINPGNSGGPLVDLAGTVIGIDTATSEAAQGISFAIPSETARPIIAAALAGKPVP
jgi:S1-C subfamily serine protease